MCLICKKKQELLLKTGGWFNPSKSPDEATTAETIENLLYEHDGRRVSRSNSLQDRTPVRIRSSLEKSNSFDHHDRGAFTSRSPRLSSGARRIPVSTSRPNDQNGYASPRGAGTGISASPRLNQLGYRPSLSDDDVASPSVSDYEDYGEPRETPAGSGGGLKNSNKKSVSFRDGHEEYKPSGGDRGGNRGSDGQRQAQVRIRLQLKCI